MAVTVRIPPNLRNLTQGEREVSLDPGTVAEVLDQLEAAHEGFKSKILDPQGELYRHVNVYLADDDVRYLNGLATPVPDGETIAIVPPVAGG
jgi:molybdopterin synthase sulfur carrier subunit